MGLDSSRVGDTEYGGLGSRPPSDPEALAAWRAQQFGESVEPPETVTADLVVVGGGMAGTAAAVAAADAGLSVIVDNADATGVEISGTWTKSSYNSARYGADYLHNDTKAGENLWVRYTPVLPTKATYAVSLFWNAMAFLNPGFAQAKDMIDEIHAANCHFIISVWCSFGPQSKPYADFAAHGELLDVETYPTVSKPYDVYNPAARERYWSYAEKLYDFGLDGWWMDSTEPEPWGQKEETNDYPCYLGRFRDVRLAYPGMLAKRTFRVKLLGGVEKTVSYDGHMRRITSE